VQVMGRWKSDVVREYLYCSVEGMWRASARRAGYTEGSLLLALAPVCGLCVGRSACGVGHLSIPITYVVRVFAARVSLLQASSFHWPGTACCWLHPVGWELGCFSSWLQLSVLCM